MDDHDQRFKALLHEFLPEFLAAFFPDWAPRFDFAHIEWLEQEAFLDPPGGEKGVLDLVAKLGARTPVPDPAGRAADHSLVLLNVEIESSARATEIRPRMLWYYESLRRRHDLPVLPVCLFLRLGLDGIGWDVYEEGLWGHPLVHFEYAYIGLPALDGLAYFRGDNLLALALSALMKLPPAERARIKAEGLARIARSRENTARKELLAECFDNYLVLGPGESPEFDRLQSEQFPEAGAMVNSIKERGRVEGIRQLVRKMLDKKFGPLSPHVAEQIEALPAERLEEISLALMDARSLEELGFTT